MAFPLVSYDSDSEMEFPQIDDFEEEGFGNNNFAIAFEHDPPTDIFSNLPIPKSSSKNIREKIDEYLFKSEQNLECPTKRMKIDIPLLNGYTSEEDHKSDEKEIPSQDKSELLELLPAPKISLLTNKSFVPQIVKRNINELKQPLPEPVKFPGEIKLSNALNATPIYTDNGKTVPLISTPNLAPDVCKPYDDLTNEAYKELVGSNKKVDKNIKLIDIHEDDIRPDTLNWMKSITDPGFIPETASADEQNSFKGKNHITSLASRAVENNRKLQAMWAENKFNRFQSRAKYGF